MGKRAFILTMVMLVVGAAARAAAKDAEPPTSYICIEADSGLVLEEAEAGLARPAASMVKLMLFLLVAEGLDAGRWSVDTPIRVSSQAQRMGGSQVYLEAGEVHSLGHLMRAAAVASANDAAYAVAEALWGSRGAYLAEANRRATELGMLDTQFSSPTGLPPDDGEDHDRTTARDMAVLAQWCVRKPIIVEWTQQKELQFRPNAAISYNTNKLLWRMEGCDGLKTGYTRVAGHCVAATAQRDAIRLVAVVMGHDNANGRFKLAQELLERGFSELTRFRFVAKGQPVESPVPVRNCAIEQIRLVAAADLWVTVKKEEKDRLELVARLPKHLRAPVEKGIPVAEAHIELDGQILAKVSLVTPEALEPGGLRWKLLRSAFPSQ